MDIYSRIAQAIKAMGGTTGGTVTFMAKVTGVDGDLLTISVENLELTGVRLRAVVDSGVNKTVITPKVGSQVLVADLSGGDYRDLVVLSCSEPEKVDLSIGQTTITVDEDGIVINGGQLDGMVKIRRLESNLDKIKNYLEALNTAIATGLSGTVGNAGVAAAGTFTGSMQARQLTWDDMEDTKVTH